MRADAALIPRLVRPNPTAGSAVIGSSSDRLPQLGDNPSKFPVTSY